MTWFVLRGEKSLVGEERVHGGLVFFPTDDDRYGRGKHSRAVLVS